MKSFLYCFLLSLAITSCNDEPEKEDPVNLTESISCSVVNTFPHDTSFFTQGLLFYQGDLYEGTGLAGKSKILQLDLKTGKAVRQLDLDPKYFGEGITILRDTLYQLTYQNKVAFAYSLKDFKLIKEFAFSTEGWGMTTDGREIIVSDGSSNLYYYQPGTFRLLRTQAITEGGRLSFNLNELEYINGYIYANQWQEPYIFKIDPGSGEVVGKVDLSAIANRVKTNYPFADFLNGIAYDDSTKKTYITGKNWPELYEVQFSK